MQIDVLFRTFFVMFQTKMSERLGKAFMLCFFILIPTWMYLCAFSLNRLKVLKPLNWRVFFFFFVRPLLRGMILGEGWE